MSAITYTERAIAESETLIDYMSVITMRNRNDFTYHVQTGNCYVSMCNERTAIAETSIKRFYEMLCNVNGLLKEAVDSIHENKTQEDEAGEGSGDEED